VTTLNIIPIIYMIYYFFCACFTYVKCIQAISSTFEIQLNELTAR